MPSLPKWLLSIMKDENRSKEELLKEIEELRKQIAKSEKLEGVRKREVEALRESKERYKNIFETAPTSILLLDKDGKIVDINPYHLTQIAKGQTPKKDFIGKKIVTHPTIVKAGLSNTYKRVLEGESFDQKDVYFPILTTGTDGYFNMKGVPILKDGEVIGAIVMHEDITDRKRAEEALRSSRDYLEKLTNSMLDAVFSVKMPERVIEWTNDSFRLIGYEPEECVGKTTEFLYPDKNEYLDFGKKLKNALEKGKEIVHAEQILKRKNGETFSAKITTTFIKEKGKVVNVTSIVRDITERMCAEVALRESEEFGSSLLGNSPNPILVINPDTSVKYVNPALEKLTGFSSAEIIGKKAPFLWWTEETLPSTAKDLKKAMSKGAVRLKEVFQKKNGERFWVEITSRPIIKNGKFKYYLANWIDSTDRKRAEEALRESEERYRELIENANDIIYTHDLKGNFTSVNPVATQIYGYTKEEILQQNIKQIVDSEYLPIAQKKIQEKLRGKPGTEPYVLLTYNKKGVPIWVEVSSRLIKKDGKPVGVQGIARDITDRKRAEDALRESEEKYRTLFDTALEGLAIIDGETIKVALCNQQAANLFGFDSPDKAVGFDPFEAIHPDDLERAAKIMLEDGFQKDLREVNDFRLVVKDGQELVVSAVGAIIEYQHKQAMLISFRDITYRKKAEEDQKNLFKKVSKRVKELDCLYGISRIASEVDTALEQIFEEIISIIPPAWQYPDVTCAKIIYNGKEFRTDNFKKTKWKLSVDITLMGKKAGMVEIYYLKKKPKLDEGPFMREERSVINAIGQILSNIVERRDVQETLRESEEKYRLLFENASEGILHTDVQGNIIDVNPMVLRIAGCKRKYIVGKNFKNLASGFGLDPKEMQRSFKETFTKGTKKNIEWKIKNKKGEELTVLAHPALIKKDGELIGLNYILEDITERKKVEERIRNSLKEKEMLLQEIHHRVKNNMQVISSLLNLQVKEIEDKRTVELFRESQNRIKSMALIHESLYQSKNFTNINFKEYIKILTDNLFRAYRISKGKVGLNLAIQDVSLGIDNAIPCGLITNELVSNSLKYAYPGKKRGNINIMLNSNEKNEINLVVKDDGVGLPKDFNYGKTKSLGLHLVKMLVEDQLQGEIKINRTNGTTFQIKFKGES